jgi:hypothetical protein
MLLLLKSIPLGIALTFIVSAVFSTNMSMSVYLHIFHVSFQYTEFYWSWLVFVISSVTGMMLFSFIDW